jgi:Trk-type K+ transport system membrane component
MSPNFLVSFERIQGTRFYLVDCANKKDMDNILYIIAVILIVTWLIGFLGYAAGGLIHLLLILAASSVLLNFIERRRDRKI